MSTLLSIIIPVYKVEKYIEACLQSILNQIPNNVEIIIVNDGTPDNSISIIRSAFPKWVRSGQVIILEQQNAGPGAARNNGLTVACGDYLGFLDSDDILLENYFELVFEAITNNGPDVVEFGFQRFTELPIGATSKYQSLYNFKGLKNLANVRNDVFAAGVWFPWTRVYKRNVFATLRFPEGVFYEDLMIMPLIYLQDLDVYFIDKALVGYRRNPGSTTAIHSRSHASDIFCFYTFLSGLERSVAVDIIRVRTARTLAYFHNELGPLGFSMEDVLEEIRNIDERKQLLLALETPDRLFFMWPRMYMWLDKIRQFVKGAK